MRILNVSDSMPHNNEALIIFHVENLNVTAIADCKI